MKRRTSISLGDLLRAKDRLEPDSRALSAIATLLGLSDPPYSDEPRFGGAAARGESKYLPGDAEPVVEKVRPERRVPLVDESTSESAENVEAEPLPSASDTSSEVSSADSPTSDRSVRDASLKIRPRLREAQRRVLVRNRVTRLPGTRQAEVSWPEGVGYVATPRNEISELALPDPLLPAKRERALLTAAIGIAISGGEPDVDTIIGAAARGLLIDDRRLPRVTLRFGAELLIDASRAMLPFALDAVVLRRQMAQLLGSNMKVLRFVNCPAGPDGAGTGPRPWPAYTPPKRLTRIILVSDVCAARTDLSTQAALAQWNSFIDMIRISEARILTLVPYPIERIPSGLRAALNVVQWRETTSVRAVAHRAGVR